MNYEDKELLIKDISARLSYVVKVKCNDDTEPYTLLSINWNKEIVSIGFEIDGMYVTSKQKLADIKPYLRPMSSMTEDERISYLNACDNDDGDALSSPRYSGIDWLLSHHFDFRGLLDKGLAIEVNESNNPYNE